MSQVLAVPAVLVSLMSAPQAEAAHRGHWPNPTPAPAPTPTPTPTPTPAPPQTGSAPPMAAAVGFNTETLATTSFSKANVDFGLTKQSGFQWYFFNFYGVVPSSKLATLNSDGSVSVASLSNYYGNYLTSATQTPAAPFYRGTAFGGGGYFEATLSWNQAAVNTSTGWPAWWSMSLEHLAGLTSEQWPGQAQWYSHFAEPDFFEADTGAGSYGGTLHDWYGLYQSAACPNYCNFQSPWSVIQRVLPTGTNVSQYHRYGMLWVPATATKQGSYTFYFDGAPIGKTTYYSQYTNQPPVPTASTPWTFGIVDQQHLVLILSSGSSTPLNVKSVQVWQASTAGNMKY